ncbi:MAG: hypothetical protein AAF170_01070, partial [Bacteroidota bacterium]
DRHDHGGQGRGLRGVGGEGGRLPLREGRVGHRHLVGPLAPAKREVLRRSASEFLSDLPDTQVHHHYGDAVVPFSFSQALRDKSTAAGSPSVFDFYAYGDTTDTPDPAFHAPELTPAMQPSLARTETFLLDALGVGTATRLALAY